MVLRAELGAGVEREKGSPEMVRLPSSPWRHLDRCGKAGRLWADRRANQIDLGNLRTSGTGVLHNLGRPLGDDRPGRETLRWGDAKSDLTQKGDGNG